MTGDFISNEIHVSRSSLKSLGVCSSTGSDKHMANVDSTRNISPIGLKKISILGSGDPATYQNYNFTHKRLSNQNTLMTDLEKLEEQIDSRPNTNMNLVIGSGTSRNYMNFT